MTLWKCTRVIIVIALMAQIMLGIESAQAKRSPDFSGGNTAFPATAVIQNCQGHIEFEFLIGNYEIKKFLQSDLIVEAPFGAVRNEQQLPPEINIIIIGLDGERNKIFEEEFLVPKHEPVLMEVAAGARQEDIYEGQLYEIRYSASNSIPESKRGPVSIDWSPASTNDQSVVSVEFYFKGNGERIDGDLIEAICPDEQSPQCTNEQVIVDGKGLTEEDWSAVVTAAANNGGPVVQSQVIDISFADTPLLHRSIDVVGRLAQVPETFSFDERNFDGRLPYVAVAPDDPFNTDNSLSPYGYTISEKVDEPTNSQITVTYTDDLDDTDQFKPLSVTAIDTYTSTVPHINIVEYFNDYVGPAVYSDPTTQARETFSETFSLPALVTATDIKVTAIYIDNRDSNKIVNVSVAAGGVTVGEARATPNSGAFNLVELTLENVPAGTSSLDFTLESPEGTGDAALLTGIVVSYPCLEPNTDPLANDDTATVPQDSILSGPSVLANDSDPDGDPLAVEPTPVTAPAHGVLTLNDNGTYTYTPNAGFFGSDSFVYRAVDGNGGSATATVTIEVTEVIPIPDPCAAVTGNLLTNGAFTTDQSAWNFYTNASGQFTLTDDANRCAKAAQIRIDQSGSNVQLYQHGIPLEANTLYRLRFAARSSSGQDLAILLHKHGAPYENYGLSINQVNLTTDWALYSVEFTTASFGGAVDDARLRIWLAPFAQAGDQYWIDDVSLVKQADFTDDAPANPTAVVTTADGLLIGLSEAEFDRRILARRNDGNVLVGRDGAFQLFFPMIERY